jgi:hypothetical protein
VLVEKYLHGVWSTASNKLSESNIKADAGLKAELREMGVLPLKATKVSIARVEDVRSFVAAYIKSNSARQGEGKITEADLASLDELLKGPFGQFWLLLILSFLFLIVLIYLFEQPDTMMIYSLS